MDVRLSRRWSHRSLRSLRIVCGVTVKVPARSSTRTRPLLLGHLDDFIVSLRRQEHSGQTPDFFRFLLRS